MITEPGGTIKWMIGREVYTCAVEDAACPFCGKFTVTELPKPIRDAQPDDTTHVCNPALGGCNRGFAQDGHVSPTAEVY